MNIATVNVTTHANVSLSIWFAEEPQRFLSGSDGFERISQPDLVVQNPDRQIGRQMQFGKNWDWVVPESPEKPIPDRYADRTSLAITYLEVMREKSRADFALWWGPEDKGMWKADFNDLQSYNPELYTEVDFRTQHRLAETMTGSVSGAELKEIWDRWGVHGELVSVPEIQVGTIGDEDQDKDVR